MAADNISSGYADTAYRSNREQPELSEPNQQGALFRNGWTMGPPLTKGKLSYIYPSSFLDTWNPEGLREYEKREKERGISDLDERETHYGRIDEEMLRYTTLSKGSWVLLFLRPVGRTVFLILTPLVLLTLIFSYTQEPSEATINEFFLDGVVPFASFVLGPFLTFWGVGAFLEKVFPQIIVKEPKGPVWELNRRTGMVKIYHHPEKSDRPNEVDVQAPFYEWDGYMLSLPDHQGFLWYRLVLVHKTREWALSMNQLIAATTHREDVLAYWDLIRQYMDVTKPLPDIPLFEAYRYLDPTTAEYDQKKGRDPRYWINMDDATYKAFQSYNGQKLHAYDWG